jgi:chromosome segregation ATPase
VTEQPRARPRPIGWIVLTGALLAAVIGLAIWAAILQSDQDDVNAASAARIDELEQEVADLQGQLEAQQGATDDAQAQLDEARSQLEEASAELGATSEALEAGEAELERLAGEAAAALSEAEEATASARERTRAQRARAELAEACLAAVGDVLEDLYASDGSQDALEEAAERLEEIAGDCGPEG